MNETSVFGILNRHLGEDRYVRLHTYTTLSQANAEASTASGRLIYVLENNKIYLGRNNQWVEIATMIGDGVRPAGPAGGDLTGNYPNPQLVVLSSLVPGSYGSSSQIPVFTVDNKGRVTSISTAPVSISHILAGGDLTGAYPNPALVNVMTPGSYGSATQFVTFAVDSKGRVISAQAVPVAIDHIAAGGDLTGMYPSPTLKAIHAQSASVGSSTKIPKLTIDTKGRIIAYAEEDVSVSLPTQIDGYAVSGGDVHGALPELHLVEVAPFNSADGTTYGGLHQYPSVTVDRKGRVINAGEYLLTQMLSNTQFIDFLIVVDTSIDNDDTIDLSEIDKQSVKQCFILVYCADPTHRATIKLPTWIAGDKPSKGYYPYPSTNYRYCATPMVVHVKKIGAGRVDILRGRPIDSIDGAQTDLLNFIVDAQCLTFMTTSFAARPLTDNWDPQSGHPPLEEFEVTDPNDPNVARPIMWAIV